MFTGDKYVTRGIATDVPAYLQNLMWYLIESLEIRKDYLQVFQLSSEIVDQGKKQKIIHTQEQPSYSKEYLISVNEPIDPKVFVIDDGPYATMLLAEEY